MANTSTTTPRKKTAKQTHVGINVLVPTDVHRKMRLKAVGDNLTLAEAVEAALRAWVR